MHEVQRKGDACEVLVELQLEELLQTRQAWYRCDEEHRSPEEVEPFRVEDGLRLQMGEQSPARRLWQDVAFPVERRHAAEVHADEEQVEEDELLEPFQHGENAREVARQGEKLQVAEQHAADEQRAVPAVDNVEKVNHQAELAP